MPPRSKYLTRDKKPPAEDLFTDREGPRKLFRERLAEIKGDKVKILVYHGVGGQGKTALCKALNLSLKHIKPEDKDLFADVISAHVDLRGNAQAAAWEVMLRLRNNFAKRHDISFAMFDIAFAVFWEKSFAEQAQPDKVKRLFARGEDFFANVAEAGGDLVVELFAGLPGVGALLAKGGRWVVKKGNRIITQKLFAELSRLQKPNSVDIIPGSEVEELLPYFLAQDLRRYQNARVAGGFQGLQEAKQKIVIFIDEYEILWKDQPTNLKLRKHPVDSAIKELVMLVKNALFVFFSREKLHWAVLDDDWTEDMVDAHHALDGLAAEDADHFLSLIPIEEQDIRAEIVKSASIKDAGDTIATAHPFLLDLHADHYLHLKYNTQQPPVPDDFKVEGSGRNAITHELVTRFIRDYDERMKWLLIRLSPLDRFNKKIAEAVIGRFKIGIPDGEFNDIVELSIFSPIADMAGFYTLNGLVRDVVSSLISDDEKRESHKFYVEYFLGQFRSSEEMHLSDETISALEQAIQQAIALNDSQYFQPILRAMEFFEGEYNFYMLKTVLGTLESHLMEREVSESQKVRIIGFCLNVRAAGMDSDYSLMKKFAEQAVELAQGLGDDMLLAKALQARGIALNAMCDYLEAENDLRRSFKVIESQNKLTSYAGGVLLIDLADCLYDQEKYGEAESLFRQSMEILQGVVEETHPKLLKAQNYLSQAVSALGKYEESFAISKDYEEKIKRLYGPESDKMADANSLVAHTLVALGKIKSAEIRFRESLRIGEGVFGREHAGTSQSILNLAINVIKLGKYDEGEELLRESLAIFEKKYGPDHENTVNHLYLFAKLLQKVERLEEAEDYYNRLLAVVDKAENKNGSRSIKNGTGSIMSQFDHGEFLCEQERYGEAEILFRKALATCEDFFAEQPDRIYWAIFRLALSLTPQGKHADSENLFRKMMKIDIDISEGDAVDLDFFLAESLFHQEKYKVAESFYLNSLHHAEKANGLNHRNCLRQLNRLATIHQNLGQYEVAEKYCRRSFQIFDQEEQPEEEFVIWTTRELAINLDHQKRYLEAEKYHHKSIEQSTEAVGVGHKNTLFAVIRLSDNLMEQQRWIDAIPLLNYLLGSGKAREVLGIQWRAKLLWNLANCLENQGLIEESEENIRESYALYGEELGYDHETSLTLLDSLVHNLNLQKRFDDAIAICEKAMQAYEKKGELSIISVAYLRSKLGFAHCEIGNYDQALTHIQAAIDRFSEENKGDYVFALEISKARLGWLHFRMGKPDLALGLIVLSYDNIYKDKNTSRPKLAVVTDLYAAFLDAIDKPLDAAQIRKNLTSFK
ncbi:MAG: hypothetical protein COB54_07855 [Alphaproteobacteria bacterium]|nr:MAG: hypothetical protein COB54_07855 [Alphaproteobacteria bacterium]